MTDPKDSTTPTTPDGIARKSACRCMDVAAPAMIAAFNLAGSRDWRFPPDVQERAASLVRDMCQLFFANEARISAANGDGELARDSKSSTLEDLGVSESAPPDPKPIEVAPGVLQMSRDSFVQVFKGSKESLLAAGMCEPEDFPVPPKRVRYGDDGFQWKLARCAGGQYKLIEWLGIRPRPGLAARPCAPDFAQWMREAYGK